jgi:hypothetical protein
MLYAVGSRLPEYRVKASSHESGSVNLIYDDEHARRHGFRAGLVPGVSLYAYVSRSLIEFFGIEWLERGSAEIRFVRPVYDGEEIRVTGSLSSIAKDGTVAVLFEAANPQGASCADGTARLAGTAPESEPRLENYAAGKGKLGRPISLELLKIGQPLNPIQSDVTHAQHWEYCQKMVKDHHSIYRRLLHPGWLATQADRILAANFDLPPWIHVSSSVQKYQSHAPGCAVQTRGRIKDRFERKGHHFAVVDVGVFCEGRCLETNLQTIIFRIAPQAA